MKSQTIQPWWEPPLWFTSVCVHLGDDTGSGISGLSAHPRRKGLKPPASAGFYFTVTSHPAHLVGYFPSHSLDFLCKNRLGWLSLRNSRIHDGRRFDLPVPTPGRSRTSQDESFQPDNRTPSHTGPDRLDD